MSCLRLIVRLDIKHPHLVKGIHMEGLRQLGSPESFAKAYYNQGADELIYIDMVASLYGRNTILDLISKTAKEIFIPLTVGGGLRSLEDIQAVLEAGADKVALNTAALKNPRLIYEAARRFGSSTIVVAIDAKKQKEGHYEAYSEAGRERSFREVFAWAQEAHDLGAGEILLTCIDQDGTGKGFDYELIERVSSVVSCPLIACGGASCLEHFYQAYHRGADAVCAASFFHYHLLKKGLFEEQCHGVRALKMEGASIEGLRSYLKGKDILCRELYV